MRVHYVHRMNVEQQYRISGLSTLRPRHATWTLC